MRPVMRVAVAVLIGVASTTLRSSTCTAWSVILTFPLVILIFHIAYLWLRSASNACILFVLDRRSLSKSDSSVELIGADIYYFFINLLFLNLRLVLCWLLGQPNCVLPLFTLFKSMARRVRWTPESVLRATMGGREQDGPYYVSLH